MLSLEPFAMAVAMKSLYIEFDLLLILSEVRFGCCAEGLFIIDEKKINKAFYGN